MPVELKNVIAAVQEAKKATKKRNFNQSMELIMIFRDLDVKKPEERIRETIELPHAIGKEVKVCVIATGDMALKARKAEAEKVLDGAELGELGKDKREVKKLVREYDFFIAEAPLMPQIGRTLGPFLGPLGKMPVPVPPNADVGPVIEKMKRNARIRTKDQPVASCRIATEDMPDREIAENIQAVLNRLESKLKKGLKGIKTVQVKASMGSPIKMKLWMEGRR